MSAALGAALKKIAVALLSDPKTLKKVLSVVLTLLVAIIMPIAAVIAIFSTDFEIDVPEFQRMAIQNLAPEQRADLQFIEDTGNEIQAALTARGQDGGEAVLTERGAELTNGNIRAEISRLGKIMVYNSSLPELL